MIVTNLNNTFQALENLKIKFKKKNNLSEVY